MGIKPLAYTEKVVRSFLRYQVTTYPFADEWARLFGRWLYGQENAKHQSTAELLHWVLYSGSESQVPQRLFEACHDEDRKVDHLGVSCIGEIVGWAMPDRYPPRNGRTSKALTALGFKVRIH